MTEPRQSLEKFGPGWTGLDDDRLRSTTPEVMGNDGKPASTDFPLLFVPVAIAVETAGKDQVMADDPHKLMTVACWPGVLAAAGTVVLAGTAPGLVQHPMVRWAPWMVGLALFGIPHGALDHRVGSGRDEGRSSFGFMAGYVAIAGVVLAGWWLSPTAAFISFLAIAAVHFGQGDLYWHRWARGQMVNRGNRKEAGGQQSATSAARSALFLAVRGLVPVGLPVFWFADAFAQASEAIIGPRLGGTGFGIVTEPVRIASLMGFGLLLALEFGALAVEAWSGSANVRRAARFEALETTLLLALFSLVPPVLAMGIYFNIWHSVRHVGRLLPVAEATREAVDRGRWLLAFWRFHLATLPTTVAALAIMLTLGLLIRQNVGGVADFGLAALAVVSALTWPHVGVVLRMDRVQSVGSNTGEVNP